MEKQEALELANAELAKRREVAFDELRRRARDDVLETFEVIGPSEARYQLEIQYLREGENIRVVACIDDGGWRAFLPLCVDFIKGQDGAFIDE